MSHSASKRPFKKPPITGTRDVTDKQNTALMLNQYNNPFFFNITVICMSGRTWHGCRMCLLSTSHITSCQGKLLGVFNFLINQLLRCKLRKVIITETEVVCFHIWGRCFPVASSASCLLSISTYHVKYIFFEFSNKYCIVQAWNHSPNVFPHILHWHFSAKFQYRWFSYGSWWAAGLN